MVEAARRASDQLLPGAGKIQSALEHLARDRAFRRLHEAALPRQAARLRGAISPARAMAEAKLTEAISLHEAIAWLDPAERYVVFQDRALLALLAHLPDHAANA